MILTEREAAILAEIIIERIRVLAFGIKR